jgi:hypothetical protein
MPINGLIFTLDSYHRARESEIVGEGNQQWLPTQAYNKT